jgi:hypothetical protein
MAVALMPPVLNRTSVIRVGKALLATLAMSGLVLLVRQHFGLIIQVASGVVSFGVLVVALKVLSSDQMSELISTGRRMGVRLLPPSGGRA